jgi:hypothetical protein
MSNSMTAKYRVFLVVAVATLIAMAAGPRAQRGRGAAPAAAPAPVLTNTLVDNPGAYYGKLVTIAAGVEQILSKTAFTIDQRRVNEDGKGIRNIGKSVLVIAPNLTGTIDLKNYLLMLGEVVKFDPAEIAVKAKGYTLDLPPDVVAKHQGRPALLATSVINSMYVELVKRPIPPMTAEELALSKVMKRVGPAFAALQAGTKEPAAGVVAKNAAVLKQALTETEAFWDDLGQSAAAQWARDARAHAESIELNVAGGNWDAVKTSAGALNQVCQACHGTYRDRLEDGTFRIKPGSF